MNQSPSNKRIPLIKNFDDVVKSREKLLSKAQESKYSFHFKQPPPPAQPKPKPQPKKHIGSNQPAWKRIHIPETIPQPRKPTHQAKTTFIETLHLDEEKVENVLAEAKSIAAMEARGVNSGNDMDRAALSTPTGKWWNNCEVHRSSWLYWRWHALEFDQKLEDGFTDPGRYAPTCRGPSGSTGRETVYINVKRDQHLHDFIMKCGERLADSRPGAPSVILLSLLIADEIRLLQPGEESVVVPYNLCGENHNRIPLGSFIKHKEGVCRHRALLFKVVAERLNVCEVALVRGNHEEERGEGSHAWNYVKLPGCGTYLVDLTREPGTLSLTTGSEYRALGGTSILPNSTLLTTTNNTEHNPYPQGPVMGGGNDYNDYNPVPSLPSAWLDEDICL